MEYLSVDRKYGRDQLYCFQLYIGLETETINQSWHVLKIPM